MRLGIETTDVFIGTQRQMVTPAQTGTAIGE
jgi:hypothetical protein